MQEVLEAISDAIGTTRTGIRLSPFITQRGNERPAGDCCDPLAAWCEKKGIAYIHLAEGLTMPRRYLNFADAVWRYAIIVAGINYTRDKVDKLPGYKA